MITANLIREPSTDEGTFGTLTIDDQSWRTGELPWRDNQRGKSCIPAGTYKCTWGFSPTKGWCYHINDVPGRSDCLIHRANFMGDEDMGYFSELRGCIAPGKAVTTMPYRGKFQMAIRQSGIALQEIESYLNKQDFMLEIV